MDNFYYSIRIVCNAGQKETLKLTINKIKKTNKRKTINKGGTRSNY